MLKARDIWEHHSFEIAPGMDYFNKNSVFIKLENTDFLDSQWINKKICKKIKNILICDLKTDKKSYRLGMTWGQVWTIPLRKEDQEWWLSKSDDSKVDLSSAMKNTDINGLHKIWTRNRAVVASKCEVNRQKTTETFIF